jgi:hypothetical protein
MRKEVDIDVETEGRDKGKRFHLTEMPAPQAEKWAIRAGLALSHAGVQMPPGMTGWAALAFGALQALNSVAYEELAPLLDEMMSCVKIVPDPKIPLLMRPLNGQDDIEEIRTILVLRAEVFNLHSGFSLADVRSRWAAAVTTPKTTRSTRTSRRRSVRSSAAA